MSSSESESDTFSTPKKSASLPSRSSSIRMKILPTPPPKTPSQPATPSFPAICSVCRNAVDMNLSNTKSNISKISELFESQTREIKLALEQLNSKMSKLEEFVMHQSALLNDLERNVASYASTFSVSSKSDDIARHCSVPSSNTQDSAPIDVVPSVKPTPNTVLIIGDSNTRHIHLERAGVTQVRIPTYVVEDIDPHKCIGYEIVWVHVGVNSLKPRNCGDLAGVRHKYDIFLSKLDEIRKVSPETKVIVSPILPTAVPALNFRIVHFNRLLFSKREWWQELRFGNFLDMNSGLLSSHYRIFNKWDKIHLGYRGINYLTSLVTAAIMRTKKVSGDSPPELGQSVPKSRDC